MATLATRGYHRSYGTWRRLEVVVNGYVRIEFVIRREGNVWTGSAYVGIASVCSARGDTSFAVADELDRRMAMFAQGLAALFP